MLTCLFSIRKQQFSRIPLDHLTLIIWICPHDIFMLTISSLCPFRVFGFVAKKPGSVAENVCHLFAELDPEQPATAIVNFINKVMLAPQRR